MTNLTYGDIWLVNYSPSIGHEYQKIRPAVVISPNSLLGKSNLFTCIAITSKTSKTKHDDIDLPMNSGNKLQYDSVIKTHHLTSYDKKRLHKYIGKVDDHTLGIIKNKITSLYEL